MMTSNQFELANPPTDVISSVKFAPNSTTHLLVSSWDKNVYHYDIAGGAGVGTLIKKFEHRAPVLDICFGENDEVAYSGGLDWDVRRIDLTTGQQTVLSSHDAPVSAIVYDPTNNLLISGSWDSTLHIHTLSTPTNNPAVIPLPAKVYSLSISPTKLVIAMSERHVYVHDLKALEMMSNHPNPNDEASGTLAPLEPMQKRESSMKFMTRAVACMPTDTGYATSSIEGRIAVDWFSEEASSQAKKYAFKCHRLTDEQGVDVVYPVNALTFHPVHQMTFASGGGDGHVSLWDGGAKRRIRQYQKFACSVSALSFSSDGKYLAVGISPGFEDGREDPEGQVGVVVRELVEGEAAPKKK